MASTTTVSPPDAAPVGRGGWTFGRFLVVVVSILLVIMWIYAFFFAPKRNANDLDDNQWAARAQGICAPHLAAINALPRAQTAKTVEERGGVLVKANAELAAMVGELKSLPSPTSARDRDLTGLWLSGWTQFVGDREAHAQTLLAGKDERFGVAINGNRGPVNANIEYFAKLNAMPACGDPGDV
jgi:hypothetical protein